MRFTGGFEVRLFGGFAMRTSGGLAANTQPPRWDDRSLTRGDETTRSAVVLSRMDLHNKIGPQLCEVAK